jgi:hypothetical protein
MNFGPVDFDEFVPNDTPEQENYKLKNDMHELMLAYAQAVGAIKFLIAHCQKSGVDPFPEGPLSLQEAVMLIRAMKPSELKKRNEEATARIVPRVKSPDAIKMKDAYLAQQKMVEEFKENPLIALLSSNNGGYGSKKTISVEEYANAVKGQEEKNFVAEHLLPHVAGALASEKHYVTGR